MKSSLNSSIFRTDEKLAKMEPEKHPGARNSTGEGAATAKALHSMPIWQIFPTRGKQIMAFLLSFLILPLGKAVAPALCSLSLPLTYPFTPFLPLQGGSGAWRQMDLPLWCAAADSQEILEHIVLMTSGAVIGALPLLLTPAQWAWSFSIPKPIIYR